MKKKIVVVAFLLVGLTAGLLFFQTANVSKAKRVKKQYKKVYNFTVEGNCSNADADLVWDSDDPDEHTLYRKIAIREVKTINMPSVELFKKYTPYSGFSGDLWESSPMVGYYFTDGYIWIRYANWDGSDDPGQNCPKDYSSGQFRLFVY